jgi:phosphoribosylanthranilate isomerase
MLFGVFADSPVDEVVAAAGNIGLDAVQLHGREPLSFVRELSEALPGRKIVKAVQVKGQGSIRLAAEFAEGGAWAVLLDAYKKGVRGGTGERFEWALASGLAAECRVILAGGLTPGNVGEAIRRVRPFMVDVSTGVESSPGVKDPALVAAFIEAARRAGEGPARRR